MGAIINGLAAHGGYMRPAIRLAAWMRLHLVYVFTHDSIAVGKDVPTCPARADAAGSAHAGPQPICQRRGPAPRCVCRAVVKTEPMGWLTGSRALQMPAVTKAASPLPSSKTWSRMLKSPTRHRRRAGLQRPTGQRHQPRSSAPASSGSCWQACHPRRQLERLPATCPGSSR